MSPLRNGVILLAIATVFVAIVAMWPRTDTSGIDAPLPEGIFDIPRFVRGAHLKEWVPNTTVNAHAEKMPFVNISTKEQLLSAMRSDTDLQYIMHYIQARYTHGDCEAESIVYMARLFAFFWPEMRRLDNPPTSPQYKILEIVVSKLVKMPAQGEDYEWFTDKGKDYINRCVSLAREILYNETVLGIPFPG